MALGKLSMDKRLAEKNVKLIKAKGDRYLTTFYDFRSRSTE
jgi:hypothetical protein